ncbi:hypothetical protein ICW40_00260, partial [Actinotalea ferrariae]|nr:hypothetical protein [Actinotalea ferrariae]
MTVPLYAPGEWYAVVSDGRLALLPPDVDARLVADVWTAVREGADVTGPLQVLLRAGIADLPPFALVSVEGDRVRTIVRGDVEVEIAGPSGRTVTGARVSTWAEEMQTDVVSVTVRTPGLAGAPTDGALPLVAGVVRAAGVRVEIAEAPAGAGEADAADEPASAGAPAAAATLVTGVPGLAPTPQPEPEPEPEPE